MEESPEVDLSNTSYKTTGVIEEGVEGRACVYDFRSTQNIDSNTYTTSELISVELYDLINDFSVPRDCYRKLVRLMNTMIRDTEKLARGI